MRDTTVTLHRLDHMGLLHFTGTDAQAFLHGQLSCDVANLGDWRGTRGSYCTPRGRVLASFLLWRAGADYFMQLPLALAAPIQKQLSMFILRATVKVTNTSEQHTLFGLAGDEASSVMKRVFGEAPGTAQEVKESDGATLIRLAPDRFEIVSTAESATRVQEALKPHAGEGDSAHWERLEIHAGIPWITPQTQGEFVPQMVNLDLIGGVSFSKGCYPGQEIVARMHYRGQLKQRMFLAHVASDDEVRSGDKLYSAEADEQSVGMVVNAAPSAKGGYDALAVVYASSVEKGDVRWKTLDGPRLEWVPLPYAAGRA